MERKIFDGRVTLDVTGENMRSIIIGKGFDLAIPEQALFTGEEEIVYASLKRIISQTKRVTLADGETDEILLDMAKFWEFARDTNDYRSIWREFLYLKADVHNEWTIGVVGEKDTKTEAPDYVQPNSPTDEQLVEMGEAGADFLADDAPT